MACTLVLGEMAHQDLIPEAGAMQSMDEVSNTHCSTFSAYPEVDEVAVTSAALYYQCCSQRMVVSEVGKTETALYSEL
jgi:hypothetical protein